MSSLEGGIVFLGLSAAMFGGWLEGVSKTLESALKLFQ